MTGQKWTTVDPATGKIIGSGVSPSSSSFVERQKVAAVNSYFIMDTIANPNTKYWTSIDTARTPNSGTLSDRPVSSVSVNTTTLSQSGSLELSGLNSGDTITISVANSGEVTQVASDWWSQILPATGLHHVLVEGFPTQSSSFYIEVT